MSIAIGKMKPCRTQFAVRNHLKGNEMQALKMTVTDMANLIRSGEVEVRAANKELTLPELAVDGTDECYPSTEIEFVRGDEVIAKIDCWMMACYYNGPNHPSNGSYIGNGWQLVCSEDDGTFTGKLRCTESDDTVSWSIDTMNQALCLDRTEDCVDEDVETITKAINAAYDTISVEDADEADIYKAMIDYASDECLTVEVFGEDVDVRLFCNKHAGKPVFTFEGADEIWDDADEMIDAAKKFLGKALIKAKDQIDDAADGLAESLKGRLEA